MVSADGVRARIKEQLVHGGYLNREAEDTLNAFAVAAGTERRCIEQFLEWCADNHIRLCDTSRPGRHLMNRHAVLVRFSRER